MASIFEYRGMRPEIAPDVFIADGARIIGNVKIGEGSNIWFNAVIRGDIHAIRIGRFVNLQDGVIAHVQGDQDLEIGDFVNVGHGAIIHCSKVGNNCLIGMGAILLGHSEIGDDSIIGAGSLVTQGKKIPARSLVYGNPARIIRDLRDDEIAAIHQSAVDYNDIAKKYML